MCLVGHPVIQPNTNLAGKWDVLQWAHMMQWNSTDNLRWTTWTNQKPRGCFKMYLMINACCNHNLALGSEHVSHFSCQLVYID